MLFHLKYNGCQKHVLQEKNRRFTDYIYFLKFSKLVTSVQNLNMFFGGGGNSLTVRKAIAICRLLPKSH